jgi:hypothetical protein
VHGGAGNKLIEQIKLVKQSGRIDWEAGLLNRHTAGRPPRWMDPSLRALWWFHRVCLLVSKGGLDQFCCLCSLHKRTLLIAPSLILITRTASTSIMHTHN